jgi:DNA-binding transcriptional LysR family regulator
MAGPETRILSAAEKFWAVGHPDLAIDLLRAFVAVVETGKPHGSGDVVGRLQSVVSQKVFRLEATLRRRIFERTSRSLSVRTR